MIEKKRKKKAFNGRMLGLWLLVLSTHAALLVLIPTYSTAALVIAGVLILAALPVVIPLALGHELEWWQKVLRMNIVMLFYLGLSIRLIVAAAIHPAIAISIFLIPYSLAETLPAIAPKASTFLFREQIAPETRIGRGCLAISLVLFPAAGATGAYIQMYGTRFFGESLVYFVMGTILAMAAVGWAQFASHQLWLQRPWAQKDQP